jgi:hypothetical protein
MDLFFLFFSFVKRKMERQRAIDSEQRDLYQLSYSIRSQITVKPENEFDRVHRQGFFSFFLFFFYNKREIMLTDNRLFLLFIKNLRACRLLKNFSIACICRNIFLKDFILIIVKWDQMNNACTVFRSCHA